MVAPHIPGPHDKTLHPVFIDGAVTALAAGAATLTLDADDFEEILRRPHWQASVEFYSDAGGTTVVQPTAGTRVITAEVFGSAGAFQAISTGGSIDFAAVINQPALWSSNTLSIKAVMASINVATHCRLRVVNNGV